MSTVKDFPIRIMHADDDPDTHEIVKNTLHMTAGIVIKSCKSGREMLDNIDSFTPDLIVLELSMPDLNGVDALAELHKHYKLNDTPLVLLTTHTKIKMCDAYKRLGIIGVLHKPVQKGIFTERIRYFWEEYQKSLKRP